MKETLVIQVARFGDLLQTRRLILSLARKGRVHLLVAKNLADLAALIYPEAIIHKINLHTEPSTAALAENQEIFTELQENKFDSIYNCNFSGFTSAITRLFDYDKIYGYRPAHDAEGGLLRSPWTRVAFQAGSMRNATPLNLVDFWGFFTDKPISGANVNPPADAHGGGIGVAVAGREARRSLEPELLANLIQVACKTLDSPVIKLFGTETEIPASRQIMRRLAPAIAARTINLCGKTKWSALLSEIQGLDLLLTPDTGLMHLAAFAGTPIIAFFLSSAWCHETGPYGLGHFVFQAAPTCSPCLESKPCPMGLICHTPYKRPEFLRCFAQLLNGNSKPGLPSGLQLWQNEFDELGSKLTLLAGEDPLADDRSYARSIIKQDLRLPDALKTDFLDQPEYQRLLNRFTPDSEWMLPPWRYC